MADKASGSVLGQAYSNTTLGDYGNNAGYAGYASSVYFTDVIKFTTPEFRGVSQQLEMGLYVYVGVGSEATVRYALCTSDANKGKYMKTTAAVADEYQIAAGTVSFEGLTTDVEKRSFTIETAKLEPDTTYYLFLWAAGQTGVSLQTPSSAWGEFTAEVTYISGAVMIPTEEGEVLAVPEIYVGGAWVTPVMEIYAGGAWVTPG